MTNHRRGGLLKPYNIFISYNSHLNDVLSSYDPVPFYTRVFDELEQWDGTTFTSKHNGIYLFDCAVSMGTSFTDMFLRCSEYGDVLCTDRAAGSTKVCEGVVRLKEGETVSLVTPTACTMSGSSTNLHFINISGWARL